MRPPACLRGIEEAAKRLKRNLVAMYYATQDEQVGLLPRAIIAFALAYALSPIDLIPDFIPVIGWLDDLLLLPALLWLAMRFIPPDVLARARERAEAEPLRLRKHWGACCVFLLIWLAALEGAAALVIDHSEGGRLRAMRAQIYAGTAGVFVLVAALGLVATGEGRECVTHCFSPLLLYGVWRLSCCWTPPAAADPLAAAGAGPPLEAPLLPASREGEQRAGSAHNI